MTDSKPLSGWLLKQDHKGLLRGWKRRWFQQVNYCLYYYSTKTSDVSQSKGSIDIKSISKVNGDATNKHIFHIATKERGYVLDAGSEEAVNYWVTGLNDIKANEASTLTSNSFELTPLKSSKSLENLYTSASRAPDLTISNETKSNSVPEFNIPIIVAPKPSRRSSILSTTSPLLSTTPPLLSTTPPLLSITPPILRSTTPPFSLPVIPPLRAMTPPFPPTIPALPTIPTLPTLPTHPTPPTLPTLPTLPILPSTLPVQSTNPLKRSTTPPSQSTTIPLPSTPPLKRATTPPGLSTTPRVSKPTPIHPSVSFSSPLQSTPEKSTLAVPETTPKVTRRRSIFAIFSSSSSSSPASAPTLAAPTKRAPSPPATASALPIVPTLAVNAPSAASTSLTSSLSSSPPNKSPITKSESMRELHSSLIKEKDADIAVLKSEVAGLKREVENLTKFQDRVTEANRKVCEGYQQQIADEQHKNVDLQKKLADKTDTLNQTLLKRREERSKVRAQVAHVKVEMKQKVMVLESEMKWKEYIITQLTKGKVPENISYPGLSDLLMRANQFEKERETRHALQEQCAFLGQDIAKLEEELNQQKNTNDEQQGTIMKHQNKIKEQQNKITQLQKQLSEQQNKLEEQQKRTKEQESKLADQHRTIIEQQQKIAEQQNIITEQHNQLTEHQIIVPEPQRIGNHNSQSCPDFSAEVNLLVKSTSEDLRRSNSSTTLNGSNGIDSVLLEEVKLKMENQDLRQKYFASIARTQKLQTALNGAVPAKVSVSELYQQAVGQDIPIDKWPRWIAERISRSPQEPS